MIEHSMVSREDLEDLRNRIRADVHTARREDLRDLRETISEIFDAKMTGVMKSLADHDRKLAEHDAHLLKLVTDVAVSHTRLRGLSIVVSVAVSAAVTTLLKALKLG